MNQFKRAKQLRTESGQSTESITDLKTAGVAVKPETEKKSEIHNVIQEEVQDKAPINLPEKEPELKDNNPSNSDQSKNTNNIEETVPIEPKPEPVSEIKVISETKPDTINLIQNEQKESQTNNVPQEPETVPELSVPTPSTTHIISEPTSKTPVETQTSKEINVEQSAPVNVIPSIEIPVVEKPVAPIVTESVSTSIPSALVSEPVSITPQQMPPQYQQYTEPVVTKPSKSTRKSAPNIFAPKGEAKSMRKSLVLKPTSVKIAENYCAKNGGSFNELIQTLLDNFIDEYGL